MEEPQRYGALQRFKEGMGDAYVFWKEQASKDGLPADWEHDGVVVSTQGGRAECRVYVKTIESIRVGFAESVSGETLRLLMEKGLVKIVGRHDSLGRPVLYGTTKRFLQVFGLKSLKDLPNAEHLRRP